MPDDTAADTDVILSLLTAGAFDAAGREWENPQSGARGQIAAVESREEVGRNCLAFTTSRQSFDGIGLYRGLACKDPAGNLRLREFAML